MIEVKVSVTKTLVAARHHPSALIALGTNKCCTSSTTLVLPHTYPQSCD